MMTIEEQLKCMIVERFGSMREFSTRIGMPQSTFSTIMQRGISKASVTNIIKICQALDISTDELAEGRIVPIRRETAEVSDLIARLKAYDVTIKGRQLTREEINSLADSMEIAAGLIERKWL